MIFIIVLYLVTLFACLWALKSPESLLAPGRPRKVFWVLFVVYLLIALGPVIAKDTSSRNLYHIFFLWPVFYALLFRASAVKLLTPLAKNLWAKLIVVFCLLLPLEAVLSADYVRTGFVQDYGVEKFISYTSASAVGQHLWVYAGFYLGLALVIVFYGIKKHVSPWQGFLAGGLLGILVEQQFLVPKMLLSGNLSALLTLGVWTFITYGWYAAGPLLLFYSGEAGVLKKQVWIFATLLFFVPIITWTIWQKLISWPI